MWSQRDQRQKYMIFQTRQAHISAKASTNRFSTIVVLNNFLDLEKLEGYDFEMVSTVKICNGYIWLTFRITKFYLASSSQLHYFFFGGLLKGALFLYSYARGISRIWF